MDIMSIKPESVSNILMFRHDTRVSINKFSIIDPSGRDNVILPLLFHELSRKDKKPPANTDYFDRLEDRDIRGMSPQFPKKDILEAIETIKDNDILMFRLAQHNGKKSLLEKMGIPRPQNANYGISINALEEMLKSMNRFSYVAFSTDLTHLFLVTYWMRPELSIFIPEDKISLETLRSFANAATDADRNHEILYNRTMGQLDIPFRCLMETIINVRTEHPEFIDLTEYFIKGSRSILSELMHPTQGDERVQPFFATLLITPDGNTDSELSHATLPSENLETP